MTIDDICAALGGERQCRGDGGREVTEAIAGDLLSFIMGVAQEVDYISMEMELLRHK